MERRRWLQAAVLMCLLVLCSGRELKDKPAPVYNSTLAKTLAEYTSAVYTSDLSQLFTWTCEKCNDLTQGFEMIELIIDVQNCLEAYIGFASDMNAIVVAFRGTQENSIQNWIEDLFWKQLDFDYPGMAEAKVSMAKVYVNYGLKDVTLLTFGQPRIGNAVFASHFKKYLPNAIRVTNEHDIVPHLPPYYHYFPQKTYHHFPREVWVHNVGLDSLVYPIEQICDDSGEDPACSRSVSGNSVQDHLHYLGISMHSESRGSCRIVTDGNMLRYKIGAPDGTIILSKQPGLSVDQQLSAL
ncbi:hypothetical protein ACQ4PT_015624 [Festuca glaucescens]